MREGARFAKLCGLTRVIMEVGCLEMVDLWNTRHNSCSTVAPILLEIGELASDFQFSNNLHVIGQKMSLHIFVLSMLAH